MSSEVTLLPHWVENGAINTSSLQGEVSSCAKKLSSQVVKDQREGANNLYALIMAVWSMETHLARDAADLVCDEIRKNGGLETMLHLCKTSDKSLQLSIAKAMEQIMVSNNRHFIASHNNFDCVIKMACSRECLEVIRCGTGIIENLFKVSAATCLRLIDCGALESVIYACRSLDQMVLQHCAAALANCAMYGEHKAQSAMVANDADHWLFPLAFSDDNVVKYYALLAICFLAANIDLFKRVKKSGTLDLVLPFLRKQDPEEFTRSCPNHAHGRSNGWLKRLVPLLSSESEEARSLAAFHFAMEAGIKKKQQRIDTFTDIDAIDSLQKAAKHGSHLTAKLCCQALTLCGRSLPPYQCWDVLNWTTANVSAWVEDIGLEGHSLSFQEHLVTGNLLVDLTLDDLIEIGFQSKLKCRWLLEEIRSLRVLADVSGRDEDNVCKWLTGVHKDLAVYRVDFVRSGITPSLLPHLTDDLLLEIGVKSSLDRLKILVGLGELPEQSGRDTPDETGRSLKPMIPLHSPSTYKRKYDVFISYRRATGSLLASLLKVHLQTRGLSVFLDVEELGGGKFDENLLTTIGNSNNFCLILTPGSLDRCVGDTRLQDWVHRELEYAIEHKIPIVPITESTFHWPKGSDLPEDIQEITSMNGVPWSHEYQDASVEKVISFLHLPFLQRKRSSIRSQTSVLPRPHNRASYSES